MKKALSLFVLLLFLLSFPVSAASGKLTAPAVDGRAGDTVTVTVRLDNPGLVAMRIFVRYDSAVLQLNSAENGDVFPQSTAVFGKDTSADPYTLLWDDSLRTDNITKSGTLCILRFTVLKAASGGSTGVRIAVDKGSTFDVDLQEVAVADATCTVVTGSTTTSTVITPSPGTTAAQKTTAAATSAAPSGTTAKPITAAAQKGGTTKAGTTAASASASASGSTAAALPATTGSSVSAAPAKTVPSESTASANGSAARPQNADPADTIPSETAVDFSSDAWAAQTTEAAASTRSSEEEPAAPARHISLLWLLLLVPVAAVLLVLIFRKK